jgi:hypothetical protein
VPGGGIGSIDDVRDILNHVEGQIGKGSYRLFTRALEPGARTIETPLVVPMPRHAQLSDDGSRIAMAEGDRVAVYEVATGRMLAATDGISALSIGTMFFAGTGVLRMMGIQVDGRTYTMKLHHFDLAHRKRTTVEKPMGVSLHPTRYSFTRDGSRIFSEQDGVVLDARSGEPLLTIPVDPQRRLDAAMLGDGTFVLTRGAALVHLDASGQEIGAIALNANEAIVIGEIGTSKVLVSVKEGTMIVDLAAKKVTMPAVDVRGPVIARYQGVLPRFAEDAPFVGLDLARKLVLWDAKTGAKRPVPL